MVPDLQIQRVESCSAWLEDMGGEVMQVQSITWYIEQINLMCKSLAFINAQMAVARKILNDKKVAAYHALITSSAANEQWFSASQGKDYVNARLAKEQYDYDVCERCSRTLVHTIDAMRSCLSALKEEAKTLSYQR